MILQSSVLTITPRGPPPQKIDRMLSSKAVYKIKQIIYFPIPLANITGTFVFFFLLHKRAHTEKNENTHLSDRIVKEGFFYMDDKMKHYRLTIHAKYWRKQKTLKLEFLCLIKLYFLQECVTEQWVYTVHMKKIILYPHLMSIYVVVVGDRSRARPEGFLFDCYNIEL